MAAIKFKSIFIKVTSLFLIKIFYENTIVFYSVIFDFVTNNK